MSKPRLRFAPSPTGSPHIGNIRTAVFDYLFARHTGGAFILRVEDTDRARYVENSLEEMMAGLRWLGMQWDEGPEVGGSFGPYFQSERLDIYHKFADQLIAEGKAFYCYCTKDQLEQMRAEQIARKCSPGYNRTCRDLSEDAQKSCSSANPKPVIRFKMKLEGLTEFTDLVRGPVSFQNELQDDFVIIKADGFPTYHFASVCDDKHMQITHVIRGEEWLSSAPKHLQLYEALGWTPPIWVHPPLILDENGKKLSKRSDTATTFTSYIENGYLPEAMLNFLATMGWSSGEDRKLFTRDELIEKFSLEGIANHPAIFDIAKLNDLNGEYIRMLSVEDLAQSIQPKLAEAGYLGAIPSEPELDYLHKVTALIQERIVTLSDAAGMSVYFYTDDFPYDEKGVNKWFMKDVSTTVLNSVIDGLSKLGEWNVESIEEVVRNTAESLEVKAGEVIHRVRLAITGRTGGPGLFELMEVVGKDRCVARLRRCAERDWQ